MSTENISSLLPILAGEAGKQVAWASPPRIGFSWSPGRRLALGQPDCQKGAADPAENSGCGLSARARPPNIICLTIAVL
jgi:hypothetical protein